MILPLAHLPPIGPFAIPLPSMRGRYLIRNALKARAVGAFDAALSLVPQRQSVVPEPLERILLANWGHLGDVITTFGAIAALRTRYPGVRIGMIVGSWGRAAIEATGLVDELHVIDHWGLNRSALPAKTKRARYRETRAAALRAIRAADYQVGIDFYPFFPVAHPLFRFASIPVRIGYTSGGFGPLLTHPVRWSDAAHPIADQYRALLNRLDPAYPFAPAALRPHRHRATLAPRPAELDGLRDYIVLHPGAGAAYKDWGVEKWRALALALRTVNSALPLPLPLVVTGAGAGETAIAAALATAAPGIVPLAGRVDWEGFVAAVAGAKLVICPDTATGHVAALFDVPVISIFTGVNNAAQWSPYGDAVQVLVRPVLCAPCNRGCDVMACIRDVEVDQVFEAARRRLQDGPVGANPVGVTS